jgi:hypothetical protein
MNSLSCLRLHAQAANTNQLSTVYESAIGAEVQIVETAHSNKTKSVVWRFINLLIHVTQKG